MHKADPMGEGVVSPRFPNLKGTYHVTENSNARLENTNTLTDTEATPQNINWKGTK